MYADAPPAQALRAEGVPVFRAIESAVAALAHLADDALAPRRAIPRLPAPASPPLEQSGYTAARTALAAAGIPFGKSHSVRSREQALAAAAAIGYPVVLKALGMLHKSDAGGVVVGLRDEAALLAAVDDVVARLAPPELAVERAEDTTAGFELIVGARRDARFGPLVLVGAGGVHAELLADTAVALAPVDEREAGELLRSLRCAPLLMGARGRPPLALDAAARVVAALSRFAAERPEVAEVEVNPLLVRSADAIALDARIVLEQ